MKHRLPILLANILCLSTITTGGTACQDEDTTWEAYEQQLCELRTDSQGQPYEMTLDDGTMTKTSIKSNSLSADTTYRAIAIFTKDGENYTIHGLQAVVSPMPQSTTLPTVGRDAVKTLACWRSKRYVNLRFAMERSVEHTHVLGFAYEGVRKNSDEMQTKTLKLRLLHDSNDDRKDYREEVIASCPTYIYDSVFRSGTDSVQMAIPTEDGKDIFIFPF